MATAAFLAAWRAISSRRAALLCRIDLVANDGIGSASIFAAQGEVQTPAGTSEPSRLWENLIVDASPIHDEGEFLTNDPPLTTWRVTLVRRKLGFQAAGLTMVDAFADYRWDASTVVRVWLWERSLTSWDDAMQRFAGTVLTFDMDAGQAVVYCRQRDDWNQPIGSPLPRGKYSRAPDSAIGLSPGTVYGAKRGLPMRPPWPTQYGEEQRARELIAGGTRVAQAILVDTGRGGGGANPDARVLVASHAVKQLGANSPNYGTSPFLLGEDGKLHVVDPPVADIFLSGADGAGFDLADSQRIVYLPVTPIDVLLVSNNAGDPRAALDAQNELAYARLDWANLQRDLRLVLPSVPNLPYGVPGTPAGTTAGTMTVYFFYFTSGAIGDLIFSLQAVSGAPSATVTPVVSLTPRIISISVPFGGSTNVVATNPPRLEDFILKANYGAAGAGTCGIFTAGLFIPYVPRQDVIQSERFLDTKRRPKQARSPQQRVSRGFAYRPYAVPESIPPTTELQGKFFANVDGYADDALGTYSDFSLGLIERLPDILSHLLVTHGAQTISQIERGTSVFGSFVDARALLKTWRQLDMRFTLGIGESIDILTAITWLANSGVSWVYLSSFDDKWKIVPWDPDAEVSYPWAFSKHDILEPMGPRCTRRPRSELPMSIRVAYGYDAATKAFMHESSVSDSRSVAGHYYRNIRDANMTVVANENDRIDFTPEIVGAKVASLFTGTYQPALFGKHVQEQLHEADTTNDYICSYGATVIAGVNDRIDFQIPPVSGTDYVATLNPADYVTMEALATEAARALSAATALTENVNYDRVLGTFTISWHASTLLKAKYGPNRARSALPLLGIAIASDQTGVAAISGIGRWEQVFVLAGSSITIFSWRSGPTTARSAAELLGFDRNEDSIDGSGYAGISPKTDLESRIAIDVPRVSRKRDLTIEARTIDDTDTARELRNRVAVLAGKQRPQEVFTVEVAPDIQRGQVFTFQADMNDVVKFPDPDSDGLWAGKRFVVTEVEQLCGPLAFSTRIAATALSVGEPPTIAFGYSFPLWYDWRSGLRNRAQRLNYDGTEQWTADGVSVFPSLASGAHMIVADGSGGAFVASFGSPSTYLQHLDTLGSLAWGTSGKTLVSNVDDGSIIPDGVGGLFVAICYGPPNRIKLLRLDADGNTLWDLAITSGGSVPGDDQDSYPTLFSDDAGGVYLVWVKDTSTGIGVFTPRTQAQRVTGAGAALWAAGGVSLGSGSGLANYPACCRVTGGSDDDGIFIVISGSPAPKVVKLMADGTTAWTSAAVDSVAADADTAILLSDGAGACIICWALSDLAPVDFKCRMVDNAGAFPWAAITVTADTSEVPSHLAACYDDVSSSVYLAWKSQSNPAQLYCRRVSAADGTMPWSALLIANSGDPLNPNMTSDRFGGAIVAFHDSVANGKPLAQRVNSNGTEQWATGGVVLCVTGTGSNGTHMLDVSGGQ